MLRNFLDRKAWEDTKNKSYFCDKFCYRKPFALRRSHNVLLNVIRNIMRCEGSNIGGRSATEICAKCYGVAL